MSDTEHSGRQLDDSTRDELRRALSNAAPDDAPASDDTPGDPDYDSIEYGNERDSWADFTPIPDLIAPAIDDGPVWQSDLDGAAPDDDGDEAADVRIVATRPADSAPADTASQPVEPRPAPKIIRIDDFGGSTEVDSQGSTASTASTVDSTVDSPRPAGAVADSGAGTVRVIDATGDVTAPTSAPTSVSAGGPRVVTISDDDLPDAVFIKGSLDSDGPSVIVIDDAGNEAHDPVNSPAGTRSSIEPRLRDRRVAIKREAGRRRLRVVLIVAAVVVVLVGVATLFASPVFAVKRDQITVTGAVYTDQDELKAIIDELDGTPALRVDTKGLESQLEAIPWVETARVRVSFPFTATIDIRERQAMATYQGPDGRFRVIDVKGRVLAVLDGFPIAYMLVNVADAPVLEAGQQAPIGLVAAAELTKVLPPDLRKQVTSITTLSDGSSLDLNLNSGTRVVFGSANDLIAKVIRLETRLQQIADGTLEGPDSSASPDQPTVIDVSTAETGG